LTAKAVSTGSLILMWTWYNSTLIKIEKTTSTTWRFWLKVDELDKIDFRAGQFITMDLPIHERRRKRWRSYSIANPPNEQNVIELAIAYYEGGLASEYLFKEIKEGDTITFKGPDGAFYLPKNIETDLVFVCTGTGVAPFRSMIGDLEKRGFDQRNIHLIFGTRYENSILYREEFEQLAEKYPNFDYTIALSREENWTGVKGYVHQVYEERYQDKPDTRFYLCGWQYMVDEARERLTKMGFDKTKVFYELYG